uniref:RING-type domain-containing protein n=1 Tax=Moniliophthora roreri TaxID=221103 RepID=A0A0W0FK75_MONRR
MALPPALVELDPETSLLIAQQLTDIRQQISRATDEDEQYALQVMADDLGTYLQNYENFQERTSVVEEPVEATQSSDASSSIEKVECIACTENVPQAITLPTPCGHYYCQSCFETLLRTALTNETFFPPWCCNRSRRIDIQRIMSIPSSGEGTLIISDDLRFQLRAKSREYAVTPCWSRARFFVIFQLRPTLANQILSFQTIMVLAQIDDEDKNYFLIANLHLQDMEDISGVRKGKGREDTPLSDEELAFQLQAEILKSYLGMLEDRKVALSLGDAMDSDHGVLENMQLVEQAVEDDHRYAAALSSGQPLPEKSQAQKFLEEVQDPEQFTDPESEEIVNFGVSPMATPKASSSALPSTGADRCTLRTSIL